MLDKASVAGAEYLASFVEHYWDRLDLEERVAETMERWKISPMDIRQVCRNPLQFTIQRATNGAACHVLGRDLDGRMLDLVATFNSQEYSGQIRQLKVEGR